MTEIDYKIVRGFPPNYLEIVKHFRKVKGRPRICFTYGNTLYNPCGCRMANDVIEHELVHVKQQRKIGGPETWWKRYLVDKDFRLREEVEAYRAQLLFASFHYSYDHYNTLLMHCVGALSGPIYGNMVSKREAEDLLEADDPDADA